MYQAIGLPASLHNETDVGGTFQDLVKVLCKVLDKVLDKQKILANQIH